MFCKQLISGSLFTASANLTTCSASIRFVNAHPAPSANPARPVVYHHQPHIAPTHNQLHGRWPVARSFAAVRRHIHTVRTLCARSDDATVAPDDSIVPISLAAIRKAIRSSGLDLHEGYACLRTVCPICPDDAGQSAAATRTSVFINKTTGTFVCPKCQLTRSWPATEPCFQRPSNGSSAKLRREWDALQKQFVAAKAPVRPIEAPVGAVPIGQLNVATAEDVRLHLQLETFAVDLLANVGALCNASERSLHFPLHDSNGTVVGYKTLSRTTDDGAVIESTVPPANCSGVLHWPGKSARDSNSAVLVLNVGDLLALAVQRLPPAIVCLPHGFQSLPQQCLPALERFGRLTLWFHNDTVSWDTARSFAKKLDERRCVFVRPTETHPAPLEALTVAGLDAKQILAGAQPILHKAITTFAALRQDVLSDIQNVDKVQGVKWTRFPVLNKLLKGHRRGELTVLTGPTGCGKTTFMAEYSLDLTQQGVTTLWGSFEIRNTRLASTLLRQLAGHPFDERLAEFDRWANEFERLPMYFMTFHGQQSIRVVMDTIEHAQYVHDIQHVIIDNVQFMMGTADEPKHIDRFWRQDAIIAAFRTFATKKNCHVTLVIHPRKERDVDDLTTSSIFGGAKATQEADNVLIIQDKRLTAIRGKKYLQVAKNRYSGDLGIMPMDFDKQALSYASKAKPDAKHPPSKHEQPDV